jgi:Mg-chelatase subunit ChlI
LRETDSSGTLKAKLERQRGLSFKETAMRAIVKTLIGIAAAVACVSAALILAPTAASAQDIGGIVGGVMRGYGLPGPAYRGAPVRRSAPAASHKDTSKDKDSDEEESDSSSSKSAKNSDKSSADKNPADKSAADKSANADNKPRRQLSNAKDDAPAPSSPAPAAKAEPAKSTVDDEPAFSPSR